MAQRSIGLRGADRTVTDNQVFHVELDISHGREAAIILNALSEYAEDCRQLADGDESAHGDHMREGADIADDLRERIDAQMGDANVRERPAT